MLVSGEMAIGGNGFWGNGTHSKQVVQLRLELGGASSCWAEIKSVFTNFDFKMALRMMHHQLLQMTFWKGSADHNVSLFSQINKHSLLCEDNGYCVVSRPPSDKPNIEYTREARNNNTELLVWRH